jgi:mono/diheme cytochrome c family protein/peroxiredoxin
MLRTVRTPLAATLGLAALVAAGFGRSNPPPVPVEPFTLPDPVTGKPWTLPAAKATVVVFTGTACPINTSYFLTLGKLHAEFKDRGVAFVAVNANPQDDAAKVADHAKRNNLPFPVLKDERQTVADRFGAKYTPEAFVLDAARVVRYRGRIDDQFGFGYKRAAPTRRDLAVAIDELLTDKPVSVPVTDVEGCAIGRRKAPATDANVTYSKDVARIVQAHCQECHRPAQIGPMPFLTYDDAAAWGETIRTVVAQNRMPPWHADRRFGTFTNARGLTDADRKALLAWVDAGCPQGDPKELPPPRQYVEGWAIGKPDAVFEMPHAYNVPADTPPRGIPYRYFVAETGFTEDKWVQAVEARAGAREVVHHIIVYVFEGGGKPPPGQGGEDRLGNGFLVGYAPGDMPSVYAPGQAKKIPKGSSLLFQMHYTPDGTARVDRSSVGLVFAKEPPKVEVKTRGIAFSRFNIPPGDDNFEIKSASTFRKDSLLISLLPHMHLRGKDFKYDLVQPDGTRETLLSVPRWDFNWQSVYRLATPRAVPAGSRIECTAHFDNSAKNKNNPDPTKAVKWGDQTWEEMMIGFVDYAVAGE